MAATGTARHIRESSGLSLQELAVWIGVARSTIHRWEVGSRRPTGEAAQRYLSALDELAGVR